MPNPATAPRTLATTGLGMRRKAEDHAVHLVDQALELNPVLPARAAFGEGS